MEWKLSDEQETYQETLRDWLSATAPTETVRTWLESTDAASSGAAFAERFARDGWLGVGISEEQGGQGGGVVELALTAEELGRAAVPSAAWLAAVLAVPALGAFREQTIAWLVPAEEVPDAEIGL